jgi:hypothetical protein
MPAKSGDNRPRKPERSEVSSSGGKNVMDEIARSTKLTAEAITKMAAAQGLSVTGSTPSAKPGFGSGLTSADADKLAKTIEDAIGGLARKGGIGGTSGAYGLAPVQGGRPSVSGMSGIIPSIIPGRSPPTGSSLPSGGSPGTAPAFSSLRFGGGASGEALGAIGKGGPWIAAAMQGLQQATRVGNVAQDPFATDEMKARSLFKMIPGADTILNFKDMVTGRQAGMERARYEGEIDRTQSRAQIELSAFRLHNVPQQAGYQALAQSYGGQSAVTAGVFDRTTAAGKTAYEDAQRLLPLRKETARLERESASATAQRLASEREFERVAKTENVLIRERAAVQRQISEGGSGVEYQKLLERDKTLALEIEGANHQVRQAKQQVVSSTREELTTRAEYQRAQVREDLLGRAENLEARGQRAEASAGRIARINPFQRQIALDTAKALRAGENPDLIPDQFISLAQQAFPDETSAALNRYGAGLSQTREAQRLGFRDTPGDFGDLYKEADTLKQQAGKKEFTIDEATANQITAAGADLGKFIAGEILKFSAAVKDSINTKLRESRNATS